MSLHLPAKTGFLLPVLSGLLLALSFPLCGRHILAWIAFVPLLTYVWLAKSPARAFWGGYTTGCIQLFILLIWMPDVLELYGELASWLAWTGYGLLILLLACFPGLACFVTKAWMRRGGETGLLLFPFIWVLVEFIQAYVPFGGFPWLTTGYSQSDCLRLIQIADMTGVYGISFLILWFSAAVFYLGRHKGRGIRAWLPLSSAAVLLAFCQIYGGISLNRWQSVQADHTAVLLQGNLRQEDSPAELRRKYLDGYVRMADSSDSSEVDLLVLPESPSPVRYQGNAGYRRHLADLARRYPFGLVFNNLRFEYGSGDNWYFNSAYYLDGRGDPAGVYDKMHLVPFGEYIPMKDLFVFMQTVTRDVGEFEPGDSYTLFKMGEHPFNAIICFEAIFPRIVRRFVRGGSQLIVNLTNDGWYGSSSAPYQHFNIARWRAIENRRFFLRAANTGISAVIGPSGRVQAKTGILQQAVCLGKFGFVSQQTFYTRYGDVFVFLCAIMILGCTLFAFARGRKKRVPPGMR